MEELLKQAPSHLEEGFIKEVYNRNNGDYMKSLMELWDIKETTKETSKEQKEWNERQKEWNERQKEWNDIRETCDSFDYELNKLMKKVSV